MEDRKLMDLEEQNLNSNVGRQMFWDLSRLKNDKTASWLLIHNFPSKIVCYSVVGQ